MEQGLSEELWQRVASIQRENGVATLEEKSRELTNLSQRVWQRVETILQTLQGQPSSAMFQQVTQYKQWLESARSGEQCVAEAMAQVQKVKPLLGQSREQIDASLPRGSLSEECKRALEEVKKAAGDIDGVLAERARRIEEITAMAQDETTVRNELISEGSRRGRAWRVHAGVLTGGGEAEGAEAEHRVSGQLRLRAGREDAAVHYRMSER